MVAVSRGGSLVSGRYGRAYLGATGLAWAAALTAFLGLGAELGRTRPQTVLPNRPCRSPQNAEPSQAAPVAPKYARPHLPLSDQLWFFQSKEERFKPLNTGL